MIGLTPLCYFVLVAGKYDKAIEDMQAFVKLEDESGDKDTKKRRDVKIQVQSKWKRISCFKGATFEDDCIRFKSLEKESAV